MTKNYAKGMSKAEVTFITTALQLDATKKAIVDYMKAGDMEKLDSLHEEYTKKSNEEIAQRKAEKEAERQAKIEALAKAKKAEEAKAEEEAKKAEEKADAGEKKDAPKTEKKTKKDTPVECTQALEATTAQGTEFVKNADGHYIYKKDGYLFKVQISTKSVKFRCNAKLADKLSELENTETILHKGWNVKYALITDLTVGQVVDIINGKEVEAEDKEVEA